MFIFFIGFVALFMFGKKYSKGIKYYFNSNEIRSDLSDKIKNNYYGLKPQDMEAFDYVFESKYVEQKKQEWTSACEEKLDINCALLSRLLEAQRNHYFAIDYAVRGCENKDIHSCVSAFKNPDFSRKNPNYVNVLDKIIGVCESELEKSIEIKWVCDYYNE